MFAIDDIKVVGSATAGEGFLVTSGTVKSGYIDTNGAAQVLFIIQKASTGARSLLVRGNNATSNQSYGNSTALTSAVSVAMSTATNWGVRLNVAKLGGWRYLFFKNSGVGSKICQFAILGGGTPSPSSATHGLLGFTEFGK